MGVFDRIVTDISRLFFNLFSFIESDKLRVQYPLSTVYLIPPHSTFNTFISERLENFYISNARHIKYGLRHWLLRIRR